MKLTDRHTTISCGKKEREILRYLNSLDKDRSNIRQFSKISGINRTTVIDNINRLIGKGLVRKENTGSYKITKKGKDFLSMSEGCQKVSESLRSPCRKEALSTHHFQYKVFLKNIDMSRLRELKPIEIKPNKLPNFTEHYLYFDDYTICIKLKSIIISIHDIITSDVEQAHYIAFHKAIAILTDIKRIAHIEGLRVFSKPHYARVESYLSNKLSKIDNKYNLKFKDSTSFWIDYSDKREDETDNALYRQRVDEVFLSIKDTETTFKDLDQHNIDLKVLKEITYNQVRITSNMIQLSINVPQEKPQDKSQKSIPEYIL